VQVAVAEVVLAGGHGEVTVAAVVSAEGDVDVRGARPQPGRPRAGSGVRGEAHPLSIPEPRGGRSITLLLPALPPHPRESPRRVLAVSGTTAEKTRARRERRPAPGKRGRPT